MPQQTKLTNGAFLDEPQRYKDCDESLDNVINHEKRQEIINILHSEAPDHYSRLWIAGYLKYSGYSCEEICLIIKNNCSWADFSENMTYCQVNSLFRRTYERQSTISSKVLSLPSFLSSSKKESALSSGILRRSLIYFEPHVCMGADGKKTTCHHKKCESCARLEGSYVML